MEPLGHEGSRYFDLDARDAASFLDVVIGSLRVKDEGTVEHGSSVRDLAELVGRALGLRVLDRWRLAEAAFFHDIGKVCIPTEILRKEGPLTTAEKDVMDTHPELGQRLLEQVPGYDVVAEIVRACHESFDGSGYPDGLAGEDIPVEARIIAVVDAYDALTMRRPYRDAMDEGDARSAVAAGAGARFDPAVVSAFLGIFVEAEAV